VQVFRTALVALAVIVSLTVGSRAQQNLALSLFERSLEQLRQESGIPGLSAAIVQRGVVVWERGFGMADLERSIPAAPETPYPVGDLTQTLAATLVLQQIERGSFDLNDRIRRWTGMIPESAATVEQVLMHTSSGVYRYEPSRFAELTPVVEQYAEVPFRKALAVEILDRFVMHDSVPGHDMEQPSAVDLPFFEQDALNRYADAVRRLAVPYRVDSRRRAIRSEYPPRSITAGSGLISSVRDLARFDGALDDPDALLEPATMATMWRVPAAGSRVPTGLGWFVQIYNGRRLVWHFGLSPGAFSSLVLKVPEQNLTLILLANSDGLSAPFALDAGNVTASLYARLFLRVFLP
jgi:CubicO group peptidase (beta-lactamase class C family)